ncbi:FixH family protein [Rhodoferax sp.]|uniref:FixH family protein n=1 Tax=Rhodoferax sp. TaxID=50421 RepID=UPI00262F5848|nr:FixH family protein [Rhodoferax sp.]MDD2808902.1 FixH family protein [Rhodoferax sp.]MDD4943500.1 FixH family protein [Rhodoferax sp.]
MSISTEAINHSSAPWWKHGFVWMVIAGPAIVVVASFVTYYLATSRPNEIVSNDAYKPQRQSDQSIEARRKESGEAPALQGRNHATTGVVPATK